MSYHWPQRPRRDGGGIRFVDDLTATLVLLWLGQSNTVGAGSIGGDRSYVPGIRIWYRGLVYEDAQPGVVPTAAMNSIYETVRELRRRGVIPPDGKVDVIMAAEGGQGLAQWDTPTATGEPGFRDQIVTAMAALGATHIDGAASIWGEADSTTLDTGYNDKPRFMARGESILDWLKGSGYWTPKTFWVWSMLGPWANASWNRNDAIRAWSDGHIPEIGVISSSGLEQAAEDGSADANHFSGDGLDGLGRRFAAAFAAMWAGGRPDPISDYGGAVVAPPHDLGTIATGVTRTLRRDEMLNGAAVRMAGSSVLVLPNAADVGPVTLVVYVYSVSAGSPQIQCAQNFQGVPWADDATSVTFSRIGVYVFSGVAARWNFVSASNAAQPLGWDAAYQISTSGGTLDLTAAQCRNRHWEISGGGTVRLPNPNAVALTPVSLQFEADTLLDTVSGGIYGPTGSFTSFAGQPLRIPAGSIVVARPAAPSRWELTTSPWGRSPGAHCVNLTADMTIADRDPEMTVTNTGAAALVTVNLPTARAGKRQRFINNAATGVRVAALSSSSDRIRNGTTLGAVGGYLQSTELGAVAEIEAIDTNTWVVTSLRGTWTLT